MKKFLIFLIIISALIFITNYTINIYFPKIIKSFITKYALENFNKKINFSEIKINIFGGIAINNIFIFNKDDSLYAKIQNLKIHPFYPSLLSSKKIITLCYLNNVDLVIKRNEYEIDKLKKRPFGILINSFIVKNLNVIFEDEITNFKKIFSKIDLNTNYKIDSINFNIKWQEFLMLKGRYNIKNDRLFAKINLNNINLYEFKPYLKNINSGYIKSANFSLEKKDLYLLKGNCILERLNSNLPKIYNIEDITYTGDISINNIEIKFKDKIISYNVSGILKNSKLTTNFGDFTDVVTSFRLDENELNLKNLRTDISGNYLNLNAKIKDFSNIKLYLEGKLDGNLSSLIDIFQKITNKKIQENINGDINLFFILDGNIRNFDYKINYHLKNGSLYEFKNIDAIGSIYNNILIFKEANLNYIDIPLSVKGYLKNFITEDREPFLNIEGNCILSLDRLFQLFKELNGFNFKYIKGDIALNFNLKGNPKNKNYNYSIYYEIKDSQIEDIKIDGYGEIKNDFLILKNGNLIYKNLPFKISGTLENFINPKISISLENEILNIYLNGLYKDSILDIKELFINSLNSKTFWIGKIQFLNRVFIEVNGSGLISLSDISKILDGVNIKIPIIEKIEPKGILDTTFNISGASDELKIKLNGFSDELNIYGLNLKDTKILLYKDKENIIISPIVALVADGILDFRTKINFYDKKITLNLIANEIDLESIKKSLKLKNKLLGKLSLEAYLETDISNPLNKLSGQGKVSIKEGNIWEINLLKGLGEFIFISDFDQIQFKEGNSNLIFKDDTIIFENLKLNSLQMDLEGGGKISLSGDVHFMLFPRFNPNIIAAHQGLKRLSTNFLDKTGLLIEVKGNIKNPKYTMKSLLFSPNKLIEIKNFFRKLFHID